MQDFSREVQLERLDSEADPLDIAVIGGGATGVGIAVDAAARGYRTALFEQRDFGKGTSSRSTKLIHGGLRYLKQRRIQLVRQALFERGLLVKNAPHIVRPLHTIVPVYSWWEKSYYAIGLKAYDLLSGRLSLGASRQLTPAECLDSISTLDASRLYGGVAYLDGVFDDARLLINLVQTAIEQGAICLNYAAVRDIIKEAGRARGLFIEDMESGSTFRIGAKVVVNATGPFTDNVLQLDDPQSPPLIAPSQGIHLVFERRFLPGNSALIVPKTPDGRVIFGIPWHNHVIVGTTDTLRSDVPLEPRPLPGEVNYILKTIAPYLSPSPQRIDIRAIYSGIRPLVRAGEEKQTSQLGRDHEIRVSRSGLVSVLGGKWTTYRHMAQDAINSTAQVGALPPRPCTTKTLHVHGYPNGYQSKAFGEYGSDASALEQLIAETPGGCELLADRLPYVVGQVIFAARHEMARSVEDVLARRLRALFLDADAAIAAAPRVAELLARELCRDAEWQAKQLEAFRKVADAYLPKALGS